MAQDPLFVALLSDTQARRDEAYTEKGAKKTAKGSVFKDAADRIKEARDEKERLQRLVEDSEGVEKQLRELTARRDQREARLSLRPERVEDLRTAVGTGRCRWPSPTSRSESRSAEVERIRRIGADVEAAERTVTGPGRRGEHCWGSTRRLRKDG